MTALGWLWPQSLWTSCSFLPSSSTWSTLGRWTLRTRECNATRAPHMEASLTLPAPGFARHNVLSEAKRKACM